MSDYTGYIVATYAISGLALVWLAARSFLSLKRTEKEVSALRHARKNQGS